MTYRFVGLDNRSEMQDDQLRANFLSRSPPSKRLPPSHPPVNRRTSPTHSSSSSGSPGESMFSVGGMDVFAVTHDTVHLETITDEVSLSTPSLHQKREGNLKGLKNRDLIKQYGKKKALKVLEGQMTIEDGNLYDMSLIRAMYSTVCLKWWIAIIMKSCAAALQVTYPLITHQLIDQLTTAHAYHNDPANNPPPKSVVYSFGLAFALFAMVQASSLFSYQALQKGSVIGFRMRGALIDLIGSKSVKLSPKAKVEMTSGKMMTMVPADASFLDFSAPMTLDLVMQPVQIVVGLGLLIWTLRYSALVGLAVLALVGPLQSFMFAAMVRISQSQLTYIDARVRLLSEAIASIRAVKLFAYVSFFSNKVTELRKKELVFLKKNGFYRASMNATMAFIPTLADVLTFITYGLTGHSLTPAIIFSGLQYFNVLKTPIAFLPMCFTAISDVLVGIERIDALLRAEEMPEGVNVQEDARWAVNVKGDFEFEKVNESKNDNGSAETKKEQAKIEEKPFRLEDIDLRIPKGALVCIIGRVGSGKSALLSGMINEMKQMEGYSVFGGSVSYVPQQTWIHSGSVRDNITFSAKKEEIDFARLNAVLDACALRADVQAMPDGDLTNVGDKGLLLSGGQRQRVSLARAAYAQSSIVLLDDPFSAVDAHVAHHIFEKCIVSALLPRADWVVVMESDGHKVGRMAQMGRYDDLRSQQGPFSSPLNEVGSATRQSRAHTPTSTPTMTSFKPPTSPPKECREYEKKASQGPMEEDRQTGSIPWSIYATYLSAMGTPMWSLLFGSLLILTQVTTVGNNLLLGFWSADSWSLTQREYMAVYAGLGVGIGLFTFGASYTMFLAGLRSSYTLYARAWEHVMKAPTKSHDQTPSGRIINIEMLDDRMAFSWETLLVNGLSAIGIFGLILYSYPWLGLAFIPLAIFYYIAGSYYRQTCREIKRINSITRSRIYSSFAEQLAGSAVIRAFGKQSAFERRMQDAIIAEGVSKFDSRFKAVPTSTGTAQQAYILTLIAIFGVIFRDAVNASPFGVVFSYALSAAALFSSLVSLYAQVEMEMNNAERIIHYISLPAEPPAILASDPKIWPSHGSIKFKDLSLRYSSEAPWILKKLSFSVGPGEKVGVVEIDGVDIKNIGIDTLRNGVGLIPQEPFLFEGTVRENMDPKGQNIDAHLNSLLSLIHLDPIMPSSQSLREKFRLDAPVSGRGNNFSGGEKQLLALMRALARDTNIRLLDEATSSVDGGTDALIQRIIQSHLKSVTIITIAHRLHTLAYYDRILVLDGGRIAEVDFTPLIRSIWQR
ncbi:cadmium ion transporter [Cryptococcus bacillisporus CA1873]|uniref:Cadmium ion transporter n=1 Tax=Cryptococcus bacillisporus CA1873 TaxID=1296111 RepID=A0ABR5BID5_CRYGA|nr:cadmium ion transporter [Cryptococcus bacillisporus CA1873]|eukprot:KIR68936.1 cadmium ion transporter [Cryptococcus gattii CA1873]